MLITCTAQKQVMATLACYQADRPHAPITCNAAHVNIAKLIIFRGKSETADGMWTRRGQSKSQRSKYKKIMESPVYELCNESTHTSDTIILKG